MTVLGLGLAYIYKKFDLNNKMSSRCGAIINEVKISLKTYNDSDGCRGITRIHRSPSRPRPSVRPTASVINIHEHPL